MGGGVHLQHHPEGLLSLPAATVLPALDLSLRGDPPFSKNTPERFPSYSYPFGFSKDLKQMRVVNIPVFALGKLYQLLSQGVRHAPRARLVPISVKHTLWSISSQFGYHPVHRSGAALSQRPYRAVPAR